MTATPDARELASRGDRLLGQILDGAIAFAPMVVAVLALGDLPVIGQYLTLVAVGFALFYLWFADGFSNGQSYGKRVLNTAVVDHDELTPCTFGQSFVRNFLLSALGPIDWLFIFGEQRRRLGDRLAGTAVISLADETAAES